MFSNKYFHFSKGVHALACCQAHIVADLTYKLFESGEHPELLTVLRHALRPSVDDRQLEACSSHTKVGSRADTALPQSSGTPYMPITCASSVSVFEVDLKTFPAYLTITVFDQHLDVFNEPLIVCVIDNLTCNMWAM